MGLGPTHTVSLAQAREGALAARQAIRAGVDPLANRQALVAAQAAIPTFKDYATAYIETNKAGWSNPKHANQWTNTLTTYAFPFIGDKQVPAIDTDDILAILEPIWTTKTETATRVRQRLEVILDAATAKKVREGANPARWRGHISTLLPKPSKVRTVKHFPAMPFAAVPAFMKLLRAQSGYSPRALEFTILTAARTAMVTDAEWKEVHGDLWTVPKERMKAKRAHAVPLSKGAKDLLDALPRQKGAGIFPGDRNPHISKGAMDALLERMGQDAYTVHGFRSSFKDWASEKTDFANEVSEAALAHVISDKTEAAYRRGALLEKRRELMNAWAKYCGY